MYSMSSQLKKRIKSLLWRGAMMTIAFMVDFLMQNLAGLEMSPILTTVIGLGLGEVSKYLNRYAV